MAIQVVDMAQIAGLIESAAGKVLVVNLWATYCPPCVEETPDLVAFFNARNPDQISFVSLSFDDPVEMDGLVKDFRVNHNLPFPVYVVEPLGSDASLDKALRTKCTGLLPTTIVYDRAGVAVKVWEGIVSQSDLDSTIKSLFAP